MSNTFSLLTDAEESKFRRFIHRTINDCSLELEIRFERSPCGVRELDRFIPGVSLQTFMHLRKMLEINPKHTKLSKTITLVTMFSDNR